MAAQRVMDSQANVDEVVNISFDGDELDGGVTVLESTRISEKKRAKGFLKTVRRKFKQNPLKSCVSAASNAGLPKLPVSPIASNNKSFHTLEEMVVKAQGAQRDLSVLRRQLDVSECSEAASSPPATLSMPSFLIEPATPTKTDSHQ